MRSKRFLWLAGIAVLVVGGGIGIAIATGVGEDETPLTGEALAKASAAALEYTHGGRVTDSEIGDEEGYYEVEVTMDDGREFDVHLDENFKVISAEADADDTDSDHDDR
jgi:hypothetical protein